MTRIALAMAVVALGLAAASGALSATRSATTTHVYKAQIKSSRGYTWTLALSVQVPPTTTKLPGYNVGETDLTFGPRVMSLWATSRTLGRAGNACGGLPSEIQVAVLWPIKPILVTFGGGDSHAYIAATAAFCRDNQPVTLTTNGRARLSLADGLTTNGRISVANKDIPRALRAMRNPPAYVAFWAGAGEVLDGSWDPCVNLPVIAMVNGAGKRLALTDARCELLARAIH